MSIAWPLCYPRCGPISHAAAGRSSLSKTPGVAHFAFYLVTVAAVVVSINSVEIRRHEAPGFRW